MTRETKQKISNDNPYGIYVIGTISLRSKRAVPKLDPKHEVVTYLIQCSSGKSYYIDDFDPESYYETGEYVEIPVYIKPYISKKNGMASYSLSVQKDSHSVNRIQGEVF